MKKHQPSQMVDERPIDDDLDEFNILPYISFHSPYFFYSFLFPFIEMIFIGYMVKIVEITSPQTKN